MARKQYSLPVSMTAAAAAAPARLAEEYGSRALWRARLDGELEIATVRDGYLYRHFVNEDGTTTLIDSAPPPPGYRWSFPTVCAGFAVCIAALIGVAIHGGLESVAPGPAFLPFIAGMAVMGIGWLPVFCADAASVLVDERMARGDSAERLGTTKLSAARRGGATRQRSRWGRAGQRRRDGHRRRSRHGLVPSQVVPGRPSRTHRVGGIDTTGQEGDCSPGGRDPNQGARARPRLTVGTVSRAVRRISRER